jgi:hypothetical protein
VPVLASCSQVAFGVRSGLRYPQRLTGRAIAIETLTATSYVLLGGPGRPAAQAQDRGRPGPVRRRVPRPAPGGIG